MHLSFWLEEFKKFNEVIVADKVVVFDEVEYVHLALIGETTQDKIKLTRKFNSMELQ